MSECGNKYNNPQFEMKGSNTQVFKGEKILGVREFFDFQSYVPRKESNFIKMIDQGVVIVGHGLFNNCWMSIWSSWIRLGSHYQWNSCE